MSGGVGDGGVGDGGGDEDGDEIVRVRGVRRRRSRGGVREIARILIDDDCGE